MSAFMVNKEHIDCLVSAALSADHWNRFSYYHDGERHIVEYAEADATGQMLWNENILSINHRYPDTVANLAACPGKIADAENGFVYRYGQLPAPVNPVVVLSAIACYEYQTCEHPTWEQSAAFAFCQALRRQMIHQLPGYKEAPWSIENRAQYRATPPAPRTVNQDELDSYLACHPAD